MRALTVLGISWIAECFLREALSQSILTLEQRMKGASGLSEDKTLAPDVREYFSEIAMSYKSALTELRKL